MPDPGSTLLMAGWVTALSRADVRWPVTELRPDDAIKVSPVIPYAVIQTNSPASDVTRALLLDLTQAGRAESVELTVPVDTEYQVISAIRTAQPDCAACGRPCVHYYDAADTSPPVLALCVDCDGRITAEVREQIRADAGEPAGTITTTSLEVTADADQR